MPTLRMARGKYLMVLIAMCGLIASSIGILTNTAGLFFGPIAEELGKETAAVNLALTISNITFAVAGMVSVRFIHSRNFKKMLIVCTAVYAATTAGLALCSDLWQHYMLNAVRGFSCGMIGNALATTVLGYWFLSDIGLISSLALGCSGLIGALINPVLDIVMKAAGWRTAYLVAAGVVVSLNLPAILLPITFQPADSNVDPLNVNASQDISLSGKTRQPGKSSSLNIMILSACMCALGAFVAATPQLFKSIAVSRGLEETGILMMTIVLIANTGAKFLFGTMTDHFGVKRSIVIYGVIISSGLILLYLFKISWIMIISAALIGLCYSIPTVGAVMICRELFSPDHYTLIYPKIALCVKIFIALGYPVLGAIYDRTKSYDPALLLVFFITITVVVIVLVIYHMANKENQNAEVMEASGS